MKPALTPRALQYATQRVEDFALVQRHRPDDERAEAVLLWCGSLGFDGDLMEDFEKWADDTFGESAWEGDLVVGFITGLFVAQYIRECPDDA